MPKPDSSKAPPRAEHPYYMHDAILGQPTALDAVLAAPGDAFEEAGEGVTEADRVYVTGMGTSLHAATVGRYLLEHALGPEADLRVASAFELAMRGKFSKADAVIIVSHRGWKRYAARVVELAKAGQATTIAVTGKGGGDAVRAASTVLETSEQEKVLHGPLAGLKGGELVVHVANGGTPAKRTAEAAGAIDAIGCRQLGVVQEGSPVDPDLFHWAFRTPKTVEPLAPLVNVIPLQLLSYYLAVQKGFDPDEARPAEPKFREAESRFDL